MADTSEKCKDLTTQLNKEMQLGQQHFSNALKISEMLEKCHIQTETKSPRRKTSKSPSRGKSGKTNKKEEPKPILRVKVSGGPDKQSFEVGTQKQTMKKLSEKFPNELDWQKSNLDFVIIPNDVDKPSNTSEKMLNKENGKFIHYDAFVDWMNNGRK